MQSPLDLLRRALKWPTATGGMLQVLTPVRAGGRSVTTRLLLATGSALALGIASAVAAGAFVTLLLALGGIYFIVTEVLGIELEVDPRAIIERAQAYAAAAARR